MGEVDLGHQLHSALFQSLNQVTTSILYVAYSGGLDSTVLLDVLHQYAAPKFKLKALHVHHGVSSHADAWQDHCQHFCAERGIAFQALALRTHCPRGQSTEAFLRQARYQLMLEAMPSDGVLCVAQHRDDQIETFFTQLLRGAGPRGLSAMPVVRKQQGRTILRPFLSVDREVLVAYARLRQLRYVDDESNADLRFVRNRLRHQVLPTFKVQQPNFASAIERSIEAMRLSTQCLHDIAILDYQQDLDPQLDSLAVDALLALEPHRAVNLLRYWISQTCQYSPPLSRMMHFIDQLCTARCDRAPELAWQDQRIQRFQQRIYFKSALQCPAPGALAPGESFKFSGKIWQLDPVAEDRYYLRYREGGEEIDLQSQGRRALKKCFQAWSIPPWWRSQIPLIYCGDRLVQVIGYTAGPVRRFAINDASV